MYLFCICWNSRLQSFAQKKRRIYATWKPKMSISVDVCRIYKGRRILWIACEQWTHLPWIKEHLIIIIVSLAIVASKTYITNNQAIKANKKWFWKAFGYKIHKLENWFLLLFVSISMLVMFAVFTIKPERWCMVYGTSHRTLIHINSRIQSCWEDI